MKPYGNTVRTPKQRYFNYQLSRARMVTEGCYGQLKGRWRVLLRKCESSKEEVQMASLALWFFTMCALTEEKPSAKS